MTPGDRVVGMLNRYSYQREAIHKLTFFVSKTANLGKYVKMTHTCRETNITFAILSEKSTTTLPPHHHEPHFASAPPPSVWVRDRMSAYAFCSTLKYQIGHIRKYLDRASQVNAIMTTNFGGNP